jgi:hypothetical protein
MIIFSCFDAVETPSAANSLLHTDEKPNDLPYKPDKKQGRNIFAAPEEIPLLKADVESGGSLLGADEEARNYLLQVRRVRRFVVCKLLLMIGKHKERNVPKPHLSDMTKATRWITILAEAPKKTSQSRLLLDSRESGSKSVASSPSVQTDANSAKPVPTPKGKNLAGETEKKTMKIEKKSASLKLSAS